MTYFHALRAKTYKELAREQEENRIAAERKYKEEWEAGILAAHPEIGMIIRKGVRMFYTGNGDNMTANLWDLV